MNKPRTNQSINASLLNDPSIQNSDEFNEGIDRDFGPALDDSGDGFSRRRWLQLMGASLALGGVTGCRYQEEQIAPFAFRPQHRIPGVPEKFATCLELGGVSQPLLSTNFDGRPIKLDGNPDHADSMGASSSYTQARMLEFYDPDRLRASTGPENKELSFDDIVAACKFNDVTSVAILAEPTSSPSLMRLQSEFTSKGGQWYSFAAINDDNTRAGSKQAFGTAHRAHYKFDEAKVIVTLDADPLMFDGAAITNSISFAKGRDADNEKMSRLYAVESQYTTTGASADHRISVPSSNIAGFAAALADAIENAGDVDPSAPYREKVLAAMASDLNKYKGAGIIVAGERQPAEVHALVHSLNEKLGNNYKTITFTQLPDPDRPACNEAIQGFAAALTSGDIKTVVMLGGNPVYSAPRSLNLAELIGNAENSVHVTYYNNETSAACKHVSAVAHPLESWKDGFSNNGSILIGQPLINPLFGGRSDLETLASLLGLKTVDGQSIVRETLSLDASDWQQAVHDGFVSNSVGEVVTASAGPAPSIAADDTWSKAWDGSSLEFVFKPSLSVYDGRFANNAWLQELPDFFTKVTWDNVASVSPKTAEKLGLHQYGMASKSKATLMTVILNGETQKIPVVIQPGQADGSIGLEIGYGRKMAGRVGGNAEVPAVGFDVTPLRSADNWLVDQGGTADATGTRYKLAIVQEPWEIDDTARDEIQARMFRNYNKTESDRSALIREGTFDSYTTFLGHHPIAHHEPAKAESPKQTNAVAKSGALPVLNQVSFDVSNSSVGDDASHHKHSWPEAFHMHHELFDLTPGTRELYKNVDDNGVQTGYSNTWGMSIDLNKCIGCNSCAVACQSENNVPVVGKDEVWRGREMHWIRIDRYYGDNLYNDAAKEDDKIIVHQPVACHHCENAPCETVCPVAATTHSSEGLNDMVYNRCIGTRYCGNNCPYKVRRFNYFNYTEAVTLLKYPGADKLPEGERRLQNLMMNPEVTVRSRGVMEKCSYCVQRIQNVKIKAKVESNRDIGPNEITSACQDACPTQAIKFGDLHNPESDVAKAHANPRSYSMLEELNNRPRTMYLARVRNPHEALVDHDDEDSIGGHGHDDHEGEHSQEGGHAGDEHETENKEKH